MQNHINLDFSIVRAFGPPIGISNIPQDVVKKLNQFVDDEIVNNPELPKNLDHGKNLVGQVKQEILIPKKIIEPELFSFLLNITKHYVKIAINKDITKFELINAWIVRQFENEYNPIHYHSGHISGAGYIMLPDSFGDSFQKTKKRNTNGNINFTYGVKQFMNNGHISYKPKVGDFYIFPNYLFHSVNPFFGPGERRSISFNAFIDDKIYNVY
tara:strand:- start:10175 stop:10813 length:639 start_codon:yes stop_codon:yes gene_type:complete